VIYQVTLLQIALDINAFCVNKDIHDTIKKKYINKSMLLKSHIAFHNKISHPSQRVVFDGLQTNWLRCVVILTI